MKKSRDSFTRLISGVCFLMALCSFESVHAQILRVDSVAVDSVWNSDSLWYDNYGVVQKIDRRDCKITFIPQGEGLARIFIALSIDSGKTWAPTPNPMAVLNNALASTFMTGHKATITVRITGGDRVGVAFKVTARQAAPSIAGNPKTALLGLTATLTPGANISAPLSIRLAGVSGIDGFCTIAKVYWDVLGDGTIDDSTSSPNAFVWSWQTTVPTGTIGQRRTVIARAMDKNKLWSTPETLTVQFGLQRGIVMKEIPAGSFSRLDPKYYAMPPQQVTLSAFKIQTTEVTNEQFLAIMGTNSAWHYDGDPLNPFYYANWFDAARFCNELSRRIGLSIVYDTTTWVMDTSKNGYYLPTEAQWEYACRAGSATLYWWGDDTIGIGVNVWYFDNSNGQGHPVATKLPNSFGVYDMLGNVNEWCNDWYGYYPNEATSNPLGPSNGTERIFRGGHFYDHSDQFSSAERRKCIPSKILARGPVGFRVAISKR